ncbi:hypothetical protein TNCV_3454561, partial [Trichonephila clavipes]
MLAAVGTRYVWTTRSGMTDKTTRQENRNIV